MAAAGRGGSASSGASSRPTGCFKCGRPGHWSRDCPSDPSSSRPDAASTTPAKPLSPSSSAVPNGGKRAKLPRKRPKLTPDLLLSNDGLGYVLEKLPRMVKIRGRGHEVEDLGSILEAYMHWHNRILPYFSFDQFVERVEKVGSMKRVRMCIHELREKVAAGEKPNAAIGDNGDSHELAKGWNLISLV